MSKFSRDRRLDLCPFSHPGNTGALSRVGLSFRPSRAGGRRAKGPSGSSPSAPFRVGYTNVVEETVFSFTVAVVVVFVSKPLGV